MRKLPVAGRKRLIAQALSLAFMTGIASVTYVGSVYAQSSTTGSISGQVPNPAGASIRIEGLTGGFSRTVQVDPSGRFQALSLPVGDYRVSLIRGGSTERTEEVSVVIGSGTQVSFAPRTERIEITGASSRIDVTSTNSGTTFTASELAKIPVAADIGAVIQLAPSTVPGDKRYGGNSAPSFGGASASENAYSINGYPVTNPLTQVGFSQLPFGSIAQIQMLEGGYGAEFGRSTGGVVNMVTKRGTNAWETGFAMTWEPNGLRSKPKNIVYPGTDPTLAGQLFRYDAGRKEESWGMNGYLSGPIIKDKLFFYFNAEQNNTAIGTTRLDVNSASNATAGWEERRQTFPRYLAKFDWNITNDHHLEYTLVRDRPADRRTYYGFDYTTLQRNAVPGGGAEYKNYGTALLSGSFVVAAATGADLDILKYTGNLTDKLTLTVLAGKSESRVVQKLAGYSDAFPLVTFVAGGRAPALAGQYVNFQPFTDNVLTPNAISKTEGHRIDVEYRLNNSHTVRAGLDNVKLNSVSGTYTPGLINYSYRSVACGATGPGDPTQTPIVAGPGLSAAGRCFVIRTNEFSAINPAVVDQSAQYIEDRWQVTDRILLSLGLRNEQFKNYNDQGQAFVKQDRQIEPRLGAAWDVYGDSKFKVSGNAGRYHLQLPANVAIRGAGRSTLLRQWLYYTGVDPATGAPTGVTPVSPKYSPDGETGGPKDVGYVAAQNLDAHFQDEMSLAFEKAVSKRLNVGAKVTYRTLKSTIEDWCDPTPFQNWAAARGIGTAKLDGTGAFAANGPGFSCASINPGKNNRFLMDLDGDGRPEDIGLSPLEMGYNGEPMPKAKRTYLGLDFFAEHPFDGKWYGKINYTWSKSRGNTEGQLNSDLGQGDPAATQAFDFKGLTDNSNGYLPNDRRHVIKAFGYYNLTPEWAFGANVLLASGRPKTCLGNHGDPANPASAYDPGSFFCLPAGSTGGDTVASPRGTVGRLPWQTRLDLNLTYKPQWLDGLQMSATVFNVTNQQVSVQEQELEDQSNLAIYRRIDAYSAPRYVKLAVQYSKKF